MKSDKNRLHLMMLVVLAGISIISYFVLPERVPMKFNFSGEVTRYGSRLQGAFFIPIIATLVYVRSLYLSKNQSEDRKTTPTMALLILIQLVITVIGAMFK